MFGGNPALAFGYLAGRKHLPPPPDGWASLDLDGSKHRHSAAELATQLEQQQQAMRRQQADLDRREAALWQTREDIAVWSTLAGDVATEHEVRQFFHRRQPDINASRLQIGQAIKVVNAQRLNAYCSSASFDIRPLKAHSKGCDTLLFHGCSQESATNIQAEGLLLRCAANGMLGAGLYGAPDPRKSLQYCCARDASRAVAGKFMFICRFNLAAPAQHAGPSTSHRNSTFDEFCVFSENRVVILWMIKLVGA